MVLISDDCQLYLDGLLSITSQAVIYANAAQEITLFNAGAELIFGYDAAEITGQPLNRLIPDTLQEGRASLINRFLTAGQDVVMLRQHQPVIGKRKNGEVFPAQASISRHQAVGEPAVAILLQDISDQARLEERLQKLSVVVEQTPAMVMVTDIHGVIEYVNPAFEKVTGYHSAEVIGANPRIIKSGLMPVELYREMWSTISSGRVWYGELCNRKKDGELYWDLGTVSPIFNKDGMITNFISVKEDITARKQNEEELKQYRQFLETLVAARTAELQAEVDEHKRTVAVLREKERRLAEAQRIGRLGSWEWDPVQNRLIWSDETYHIFGVDPAGFALTYANALERVHPDDREALEGALQATLSSGQPYNLDFRVVMPDGRPRVLNLNVMRAGEAAAAVSTLVGTVQDISERVRIANELREKERMAHDLDVARRIQLGLLPRSCPDLPGWQFAVFYQPAREVGGDFYDFIPLPEGRLGLVIADVVDKGVPAALLMTSSRMILRTVATSGASPTAALRRSNDVLYNESSDHAYVTAFFASLDPHTGQLDYANAGHIRPLWFSARSGAVVELKSRGIVLGVTPQASIEQKTAGIDPGDALIFCTDGLTEATNPQGAFFGEERLVDLFRAHAHRPASAILEAIVAAWQDFTGGSLQADDISLVVVRRIQGEESRKVGSVSSLR